LQPLVSYEEFPFLGHPESCAELVSVLFQGLRNLQVREMLNRGSA